MLSLFNSSFHSPVLSYNLQGMSDLVQQETVTHESMDRMKIMDLPFTQWRHHSGRMYDSVRSGPLERLQHVHLIRDVDLDILVNATLKRIDPVVVSVSRIVESVKDVHHPLRMLLL